MTRKFINSKNDQIEEAVQYCLENNVQGSANRLISTSERSGNHMDLKRGLGKKKEEMVEVLINSKDRCTYNKTKCLATGLKECPMFKNVHPLLESPPLKNF